MNCAELLYVVFSVATKLSSKTPKPKRDIATVIEIDSTNIISRVRNFNRISVGINGIEIRICQIEMECVNIKAYQNMASNAVHCRPSESIVPNRVDTWWPKCRKMSWIPANWTVPPINFKNSNLAHKPHVFEFVILSGTSWYYSHCNCQYPRNDCMWDHVIRCTFPMWPILWRTTISAQWQSILANKMLKIFVHFVVGRDKCTAKTWAANTRMLPAKWHPACLETTSWSVASSEKMDLSEETKTEEIPISPRVKKKTTIAAHGCTYYCRTATMAIRPTSISVRWTNRRQCIVLAYAKTSTSQWTWTIER